MTSTSMHLHVCGLCTAWVRGYSLIPGCVTHCTPCASHMHAHAHQHEHEHEHLLMCGWDPCFNTGLYGDTSMPFEQLFVERCVTAFRQQAIHHMLPFITTEEIDQSTAHTFSIALAVLFLVLEAFRIIRLVSGVAPAIITNNNLNNLNSRHPTPACLSRLAIAYLR